ncbi:MAG TPA: hypothetical protein ENI70_01915 [Candidatus Peregrinibacteria bacterium]|nr:hypothetical protein [Candidatus Peregrinibacteria bacterium]
MNDRLSEGNPDGVKKIIYVPSQSGSPEREKDPDSKNSDVSHLQEKIGENLIKAGGSEEKKEEPVDNLEKIEALKRAIEGTEKMDEDVRKDLIACLDLLLGKWETFSHEDPKVKNAFEELFNCIDSMIGDLVGGMSFRRYRIIHGERFFPILKKIAGPLPPEFSVIDE